MNVRAIAQGASERNISVVVDGKQATRALRATHASFYLSPNTLSIGVIGPGTVGRVLLEQLASQQKRLAREFSLDLRVRGIMGSKRMLLSEGGATLGRWREEYEAAKTPADLMPTDRVVDMIEEGVDIAIRIGRLADTSFMARKIGEDVRLVCASPSYLRNRRALQRPEDLTRHNCIISRDRSYLNRWPFRIDGEIREIEVGGRVAVTEGEAQMRLALQGLGIVRLTRLTVATAIKNGELVSLLEAFRAEQPIPIHAVYPHRRHLAPKVTAFIDFILEKFSPPPWEI